MGSAMPTALDIIVRSSRVNMVTHEIILVHGFKSHLDDEKRLYKFRNLLENWVKLTTDSIRDRVNIRTFAFDGDHILHNGKHGLSDATIKLSRKFATTCEDPSSPLFRRRVEEGDRDREHDRASRSAVFIAHGLGTWVVKDFLVLFRKAKNRVDPTGLIFLDGPDTPPNMTPIDVRSESAVSQYLYELTEIYKIQATPFKVNELQDKLRTIDMNFRLLTNSRYGVCEEARDKYEERSVYTMKMWCDNLWMSSNPRLATESSKMKSFMRGVNNLMRVEKVTKMEEQLKKLEPLKLTMCLEEATALHKFYDIQPDDGRDDIEAVTNSTASQSSSYQAPDAEKGKQKADSSSSISTSRRGILTPSNSMKPLPKIPEEREAEHHHEQAYGFRPSTTNNSRGEKFYDFDDAVAQRNEAADSDDQDALAAAQSRLQLVKRHQEQHLGKTHLKVLITQREIITTSLASGVWNGKRMETWGRDDFRGIEDEMHHAFRGLEESLGPLHRETLESLSVLFSVRVSLVKVDVLPRDAVAEILDTAMQRLRDRAAGMPDLALDTLKIKYKVAVSLAQISEQGDAMLEELLKETEGLILTAGRRSVGELTALRSNVLERIAEVRQMRRGEE
ncbi:uncharacterized protein F4812DRAFT_469459 [Daldinia caldariorum]|uniref:uncharacterized protein n=1 Tax=Daldinia caldariorum TaxID=326644 RepID=UPI002007CFC8|nr:uncharacterized protein F4812DRAFT_469459 [Daldinia caldariorum]KAI1463175.1 hypothetical protein F4812DRAFT_469459 [Daldinia caldariorum]